MTHYRLERQETLEVGAHRIMSELVDEALGHLEFRDGATEGIHEARKVCKKARGLARLVRPALDEYGEVNRHFRDAARQLAPIRDPQAFLETFDVLAATPAAGSEIGAIRDRFAARADQAEERLEVEDDRLDNARKLIRSGRFDADDWKVDHDFESIEGGIKRTYRRGRHGLEGALRSGDPVDFHEWRKRVKYLWYQLRLLRNAAPSVLRPLASRLHDISDALGDAHDLALMSEQVTEMDVADSSSEVFRIVAAGYRVELEQRALSLGRRLYAEKPSAFVGRLERYWETWQEYGAELDAGAIEDISPT